MGVHEHKAAAPTGPVSVRIAVVSSSRTTDTDESGLTLTAILEGAGHKVLSREVVDDDRNAIAAMVRRSSDVQVVLLTGGTGMSLRDVTPEAVEPLFDRAIPGFGELFRWLSFQEIGPSAMLSRATAGMVGDVLVVALPGSPEACRLALGKLILPELRHLVREVTKEAAPGAAVSQKPATPAPSPARVTKPAAVAESSELPAPSGAFGRLGRPKVTVGVQDQVGATAAPAASDGGEELPRGWQRAVYDLRGEVKQGGWHPIPETLEAIAPVVDVLHTSGERGQLVLPDGRVYGLFGWPDLKGAGSKVLAIGEGHPFAEILALHRHPAQTGTCVEDAKAFLPKRHDSVGPVAEAVTGRAPKDSTGELLALQGDAVWIQRGTRAFRWDGSREKDDGTPKQVLASLILDWSRR